MNMFIVIKIRMKQMICFRHKNRTTMLSIFSEVQLRSGEKEQKRCGGTCVYRLLLPSCIFMHGGAGDT